MLQQLLEFGLHHLTLILAFSVVLVLFLTFELHSKLTGTPAISPQSVTLLMNHNDALVIDIREKNHFMSGNILGSMNIPLAQLEKNLNKLQSHKDKPVILVYVMGQTHHKATHFLKKNGFTDLYLLKGGIAAWQQAGLPLVKK